jgi:hypothetical protein
MTYMDPNDPTRAPIDDAGAPASMVPDRGGDVGLGLSADRGAPLW